MHKEGNKRRLSGHVGVRGKNCNHDGTFERLGSSFSSYNLAVYRSELSAQECAYSSY